MAENAVKQAPLPTIRLISSRGRALISPGAENDKKERQNSGGNGEVCFVSEWLDNSEDEALLHEAMDAFDNGLNNKSSLGDEHCLSFSHQNDKNEKNLESKEILIKICTCKNASASSSPQSETGDQNPDQVKAAQGSAENEISKDCDTKETLCETCHRTIAKRGESDISENSSPTKKAKIDLEDEAGKFTMDPLRQFKGKYLWVSDLTAQAWCERQLLYDFTFEGPIEILETEAMKVGTEMHLKRELEVHTIKQIAVKSREDKWAIKFLNILSAVHQLLQGGGGGGASRCVIREMPIFGKPFQSGTFVVGVIDEIRYNSQDQLEVVEFKTRAKSRTLPSAAQRKTHKLQVMLYKQLFDEAVCGLLKKETILETIGLDPEATVNDEITAHALGMDLVLPKFGDYLNAMLERFQFLPKIDSLAVEYSSQDDKEPFAVNEYMFDPVWLKERLDYYNAFWVGEREVEGVDLEEVWKCNFCNYREECDWRLKMREKCLSKKAASRVQIKLTK